MNEQFRVSLDILDIDCPKVAGKIEDAIREAVLEKMKKRGAVIGLSGGIDSSVCAAACVRAFGKKRVFGIFMPDWESAKDTLELSRLIADHLGIDTALEDISALLQAAGCYRRRDEAIREVIPEYGPGWKSKIVLPNLLGSDKYRVFSLVAASPEGNVRKVRLTHRSYLGILAAMNFKQRVRKMMEYYHADRLNYAVAGTPNRLEYDQGFFVKNGDGAADFKPIAHLYKTQVYQLAAHYGIPERIRNRPPTTDTYSMPQSQEEFYFSLPYDKMDFSLYCRNHDVPPESAADVLGLTPEQVERIYQDIDNKRRVTRYLQMAPQLVEHTDGL